MLIVGGLLALGLLALIGAVLLAFGETRSNAAAASAPSTTPAASAPASPALAAQAPQPTTSASQPLKAVAVHIHAETPTGPLQQEPITEDAFPLLGFYPTSNSANDQIQALARELLILRRQAAHLEQRLSTLVEMTQHIKSPEENDKDESLYQEILSR